MQAEEISSLKMHLQSAQSASAQSARRPGPPPPPPPTSGAPPPPPPPPPGAGPKQKSQVSNMFATNLRARQVAGHDASQLAKIARRYVGSNLTNENIRRNYAPKYKWAINSVTLTDAERKKRGLPVNVVGKIIPKLNKTKALSARDLEKHFQDLERAAQRADIMSEMRARFAKRGPQS